MAVKLAVLTKGALLIAAVAAIAACRPSPQPPVESPPPPEASAPDTARPGDTQPGATLPDATPPPSTEQIPAAPTSNTTLPNALVAQWQPLSNVLLAFGPMTITPEQVQWDSGQSTPYRLIGTEGGYLLELEARPSFYDTQNQYLKLIPKADTNGAADSIEVAFYTDASQLQNDDYIMYGSYFAE